MAADPPSQDNGHCGVRWRLFRDPDIDLYDSRNERGHGDGLSDLGWKARTQTEGACLSFGNRWLQNSMLNMLNIGAKKIENASVGHFALRFGETMRAARQDAFLGSATGLPYPCRQTRGLVPWH